jgi:hypothetical protein
MKKIYVVIFLIVISVSSYAQVSLRGSMGIQYISIPSLTDYLYKFPDDPADFTSAIAFSFEGGYPVSENTEVALEVAYLYSSFTSTFSGGRYTMSYDMIMPSLLYYYVVKGAGYNFKFGGGAGARFTFVDEKYPAFPADNYSSTGVGFLLKADGNTSLGGNFYANIGGDIRYDLNGEPEMNGMPLRNEIVDENVNMKAFSIGVKLGITYQF